MNLNLIKNKIKEGLSSGAEKILPPKMRDELGLSQPNLDTLQTLSQSPGLDSDLNTFFKPVNSTFLSTKDYRNIQNWTIAFIVLLAIALVFLFFSLIVPHKDFSNALEDSQVIVKGNDVSPVKEKIVEAKTEEPDEEVIAEEPNEELQIENIIIAEAPTKELAQNSPLLQSESVTLIEYKIRSGDTLEKVARRFYGRGDYDNIQKIKGANSIRNTRLLQIGQKLIIPM